MIIHCLPSPKRYDDVSMKIHPFRKRNRCNPSHLHRESGWITLLSSPELKAAVQGELGGENFVSGEDEDSEERRPTLLRSLGRGSWAVRHAVKIAEPSRM